MKQWPISTTKPKDERGRDKEQDSNYLDEWHVPSEYHAEGMALQYVEVLRMAYPEIMELRYSEFLKLQMLHKAVTMRRPARFKSEHEYMLEKTAKHYGLR